KFRVEKTAWYFAGATANDALSFQRDQPARRRTVSDRLELGDGRVTIQHKNGFAVSDVVEIPADLVFKLGNTCLFHMAIIASSVKHRQVGIGRLSWGCIIRKSIQKQTVFIWLLLLLG